MTLCPCTDAIAAHIYISDLVRIVRDYAVEYDARRVALAFEHRIPGPANIQITYSEPTLWIETYDVMFPINYIYVSDLVDIMPRMNQIQTVCALDQWSEYDIENCVSTLEKISARASIECIKPCLCP